MHSVSHNSVKQRDNHRGTQLLVIAPKLKLDFSVLTLKLSSSRIVERVMVKEKLSSTRNVFTCVCLHQDDGHLVAEYTTTALRKIHRLTLNPVPTELNPSFK